MSVRTDPRVLLVANADNANALADVHRYRTHVTLHPSAPLMGSAQAASGRPGEAAETEAHAEAYSCSVSEMSALRARMDMQEAELSALRAQVGELLSGRK